MSLPPERVNIKRKRDAESVDVLFIQDSKRSKTEYVFRKIRQDNALQNPFQKLSAPGGGEAGSQQQQQKSQPGATGSGIGSRPQTPRDKLTRSMLKPRRFHLERPSTSAPGGGGFITKRSGSPLKTSSTAANEQQQKRLAVLVEKSVRKKEQRKQQQQHRDGDRNGADTGAGTGRSTGLLDLVERGRSVQQQYSLPPSPTKKTAADGLRQQEHQQHLLKPRASAAELRWREEKWGPRGSASRSVSRGPTPTGFDARELKLAHDLDAWAREEESKKAAAASVAGVKASEASQLLSSSPRKRPLKFQPNPSAAGRRNQPEEDSTALKDDDSADESESEYEFDVYERVPIAQVQSGTTPTADAGRGMDLDVGVDLSAGNPELQGKSVGILIIEDEDEDLWASYQEAEDSDFEFDTDEEDENAEDYYGNDYPEDEMDSDDEHGHGAYGYRYAGSDDEHYGDGYNDEDEGGISGDEGLSSHPAATRRGDAREFMSPVQNGGLHPY